MKINRHHLLFLIVVVAIILRIWNVSSVPPSPSLDEVSIGYNAYSILKTGADEYGTRFPLILRAYDDFRPALYVYLVAPFIHFLGLTAISVRLPSVILSILTIIATYFLVKELFRKLPLANSYSLMAATSLAISPWHIYISRLGHEANLALTLFVFGLLFFLKAIYLGGAHPRFAKASRGESATPEVLKRILLLLLSAICFVGSFYAYQSTKVFIPLFVFVLVMLFRKKLLTMKREVVIAGIIGMLLLIPIVQSLSTPQALIRFQGTNVLTASSKRFEDRSLLLKEAVERNDPLGQVIHNRRIVAVQIVFEQYLSHFNPAWLFSNRGDEPHKIPGLGLFYIWEGPLMILGFIFLLRSKLSRPVKLFLFFWILLAPIPAAITTDAPHAMRTYNAIPVPQIVASLGFISILEFLKKYRHSLRPRGLKVLSVKYYVLCICLLTTILSLLYFYKQYFFVFPQTQSASFQYALFQATPYVLDNEKSYNKIVFSNKDALYQSYMFFLFFTKYDPKLYQSQGGTKSGGFAETHKFGKFEFRPISWKSEIEREALYIGNFYDFPEDIIAKKTFSYLDGKEVIKVVERK